MPVTVLDGANAVHAAVGQHLGYSDWLVIDQQRVDTFATATGNEHGSDYLLLSLSNFFLPQIVEVTGFAAGVNYGTNEVRFIQPLSVGSSVRAGAELTDVADVAGGLQTTITITIESEIECAGGVTACTVESLSRWLL